MSDHYRTLQVREDACPEVISAAYRALAKKRHPDASPYPQATQWMRALNEAHETLSDPVRRAQYDARRASDRPTLLMPWGKHAGTPVADLPRSYLAWLVNNVDNAEVRAAAEQALGRGGR